MCNKSLFLKIFLLNLLYTSLVTCEEVIKLEDDEEHFYNSTGYKSHELKITIDHGYQLFVEVLHLQTVFDKPDFLIIKSGDEFKDEGTGMVFSQKLKKPEEFVIVSTIIWIKFFVEDPTVKPSPKRGFVIRYKRIGEQVKTTTPFPITTNTWPTAAPEEPSSIDVYVKGTSLKDKNVVEKFKTAVAKMAVLYCDINNILYDSNKDITDKNVMIHKLEHCSYNWPDAENCFKITFSVPIILMSTSKKSGYELSSANLELMWERYAARYLKTIDLEVYDSPNPDAANSSWEFIIGITLFIFVAIIIAIIAYKDRSRLCGGKNKEEGHKVLSNEIEGDINVERESVISLPRPYPDNIMDIDFLEENNRPYPRATRGYFINESYEADDEEIINFDRSDALSLSGIANSEKQN